MLVDASDALVSVFGVWLEHFEWFPAILPWEKLKIVKGISSSFKHKPALELASTFKTPCPVRIPRSAPAAVKEAVPPAGVIVLNSVAPTEKS